MRTDLPDVMVAEPDVTRVRLERRSAQVAALALDRPHSSHADWSEPFLTSPRPPAPAVPDEVGPHIVLRVVRYEPIRSALTAARREAGLTISDLARSLHVSRPTVSGWERGTRAAARYYWPALASALRLDQVQVSQLFRGYPAARLDGVRLPSLAAVRREAGMTQQCLATRVGVRPTTLAMWENTVGRVPRGTAGELAEILQVPIQQLTAVTPTKSTDPRPLRRLRKAIGMSRREAAAQLRISVGTLSRYEAGGRSVPIPVVRRMAFTYGRSTSELLRLSGRALLPLPIGRPWRPVDVPAGITALRTTAGLSKEELGRAVQRSGQAVGGWERGRTRPSPATCRRLEAMFCLPAGTFPF